MSLTSMLLYMWHIRGDQFDSFALQAEFKTLKRNKEAIKSNLSNTEKKRHKI